jgi:single-strand DNA-binding protein
MNKVFLIGRVGQDPERKEKLTTFSIATSNGKDKPADWHNCVCFERTAQIVNEFVKKGDMISIIGKISYNKKDDKTYTSIIVNELEMLGGKPQPQQQAPSGSLTVSDVEKDSLPF